jgi:hypothetical protein
MKQTCILYAKGNENQGTIRFLVYSFTCHSLTYLRMKRLFILLSVILLTIQTAYAQVSFGKPELINDQWQFQLGDDARASSPDYDATNWRTLDLPHDWSVEGVLSPGLAGCTGYLPGGIGWYRKTLNIPASRKGEKVFLYFEGVYNRSEVFVNGVSVGKRPNGYISFLYDITPTPYISLNGAYSPIPKMQRKRTPCWRWKWKS